MARFLFILLLLLCCMQRLLAQNTSLPVNHTDTITANSNSNSDDNYKWGIFYFNKNDSRIFPPKGNGLGWTINFANPLSVGTFILLIYAIFLLNSYFRKGRKGKDR